MRRHFSRAGVHPASHYAIIRAEADMRRLDIRKAFTLIEPGPVVFVTTNDGAKDNVMTITWTMALDFDATFAITTGPWNYSYAALRDTRECTVAIPAADMIDTVVGVGMCTGQDTDKFHAFALTPVKSKHIRPPCIKECLANIECRVVDILAPYNIVVLKGVAAYCNPDRKERRTLHATGDGTFVVDGRRLDRRRAMRAKLPGGV